MGLCAEPLGDGDPEDAVEVAALTGGEKPETERKARENRREGSHAAWGPWQEVLLPGLEYQHLSFHSPAGQGPRNSGGQCGPAGSVLARSCGWPPGDRAPLHLSPLVPQPPSPSAGEWGGVWGASLPSGAFSLIPPLPHLIPVPCSLEDLYPWGRAPVSWSGGQEGGSICLCIPGAAPTPPPELYFFFD